MIDRTAATYRAVVGTATVLAIGVLSLMLLDRPALGDDARALGRSGDTTIASHRLGGHTPGPASAEHGFGARVLGAEGPGARVEKSRPATFGTFRGEWTGHTRTLKIRKAHGAREQISIGCCEQVADIAFEVRRVRGTTRHGSIRATVVKTRRFDEEALGRPAPEVGDVVRLRLDRGILTEPASGTFYCNEKRGREGTCGA